MFNIKILYKPNWLAFVVIYDCWYLNDKLDFEDNANTTLDWKWKTESEFVGQFIVLKMIKSRSNKQSLK